MRRRDMIASVAVLLAMLMSSAGAAESGRTHSPLEELPVHIRRLTHFGQRADFSHDGKRILFLERTFGDAFEVEVATGIITPVTHHFFHEGFTRALYLANGDILLSGSRHFDATDPWPSRHEDNAELWVLDKRPDPTAGGARRALLRGTGRLTTADAHRLDTRRRVLVSRYRLCRRHTENHQQEEDSRSAGPALREWPGDAKLPPTGRKRADLLGVRLSGHRGLRP